MSCITGELYLRGVLENYKHFVCTYCDLILIIQVCQEYNHMKTYVLRIKMSIHSILKISLIGPSQTHEIGLKTPQKFTKYRATAGRSVRPIEHMNRFSYSTVDYMVNLTLELKIMFTPGRYRYNDKMYTLFSVQCLNK